MFVTAKANSLVEVWPFPFSGGERPPLRHESFGQSQVNGVAVDQARDLLYISVSRPASVVAVFALPDLTFVRSFVRGADDLGDEPGLALVDTADGQSRVYVSSDAGRFVHVYDAASGAAVAAVPLPHELETILFDPFYGVVYIPDETGARGVLAYDRDLAPYQRDGRHSFGAGLFQNDAEGAVLYTCPGGGADDGRGFIVVADQRRPETDLEFFDRQSWDHLGSLRLAGVSNTDGLGSSQAAWPGYPLGILAAIDDDGRAAGIGWDRVLAAMDVSCS